MFAELAACYKSRDSKCVMSPGRGQRQDLNMQRSLAEGWSAGAVSDVSGQCVLYVSVNNMGQNRRVKPCLPRKSCFTMEGFHKYEQLSEERQRLNTSGPASGGEGHRGKGT